MFLLQFLAVICSADADISSQAHSFLASTLFTSFVYTQPTPRSQHSPSEEDDTDRDDEPESIGQIFEINFPALLETLQIFGITDPSSSRFTKQDPYTALPSTTGGAFSSTVLGMGGLCRLSYEAVGSPLEIIMEEAGVRTTCELTTYEPEAYVEDIPFMRSNLHLKIILRSVSLHDALGELASTQSERILFAARDNETFEMSAEGPLGSANVEFNNLGDSKLMETFQLAKRKVKVRYKFGQLKAAARAMAVATKVSMRIDQQGVLSLQFMIEVEGGSVSFVDFRFVPLIKEDGESEHSNDTDDEE